MVVAHTVFKHYAEARAYADRAKRAAKGRPLCVVGWRVYAHTDRRLMFTLDGVEVAWWEANDNLFLRVPASRPDICRHLHRTIQRVLPLWYTPIAARPGYAIVSTSQTAVRRSGPSDGYIHHPDRTLRLDMTSGVAIGYTPVLPLRKTYDPVNRAKWLAAKKAFLHGVALRDRLGYFSALPGHFDPAAPGYTPLFVVNLLNLSPHSDIGAAHLTLLYTSLVNEEFPDLLMRLLKVSADRYGVSIQKHALKILSTNSYHLRKQFNVFTE